MGEVRLSVVRVPSEEATMQIETLRYFVNLVDAGSFYGAAKRSYISQQGLNKAITSLEAEIGATLVERGNRGIRPTALGETFYAQARRVLREYELLQDCVFGPENPRFVDDPILIHTTYYPAQVVMPLLPGLGFFDMMRLNEVSFDDLVEEVHSSRHDELYLVDLYCDTIDELLEDGELMFEPVLVSRFGVVWKDGSPFENCPSIHRDQLTDFPLAMDSQRDMLKLVDQIFEDYPLDNVRFGVSNPRATLGYAASSPSRAATFDSFGFTLAQRSSSIDTEGLHYTPLSTPRSLCRIGFLHRKDAHIPMRCRHAMHMLRRYLSDEFPDYFRAYPIA